MKNKASSQKGIIFYDGLCLLCSREIEHYRKQEGSDRFVFIDITQTSFDATQYNVDPYAVHKVMHVMSPDGQLFTGVDAFRTIWKELPKYQFLHRWTESSFPRAIMNIGYSGFVRIRPYLPRKKTDCATSPYCDLK